MCVCIMHVYIRHVWTRTHAHTNAYIHTSVTNNFLSMSMTAARLKVCMPWMYACMHACVFVCKCTCMCERTMSYTPVNACVYACMQVCLYLTDVHLCIEHIRKHAGIDTRTYVFCSCIYVCMHTHTQTKWYKRILQ